MKQLIIDESKWVHGGNNNILNLGASKLLNDKGNMCCLGFYAKSCKFSDQEILYVGTLGVLKNLVKKNTKGKIVKKVFAYADDQSPNWEDIAVSINDDRTLTLKSRKLKLINHFKKIKVKLVFVKSKKK